MQQHKPERLNLAIARRCFVACKGCYSFFGKHEPDLTALIRAIASFVHLGIYDVTISGGDPLTIEGLVDFLVALRTVGVSTIKLDTVGTGLLFIKRTDMQPQTRQTESYLMAIVQAVDYLGIPLDGWSNASVQLFRAGRPGLFNETVDLLNILDELHPVPNIIINTVVHRHNLKGLALILEEIRHHRSICHWNVFQYTPTDQAAKHANEHFEISSDQFHDASQTLLTSMEQFPWSISKPTIEFRSIESRLGKYLLINSDGTVWVPNEHGHTIALGSVFGREHIILEQWSCLVNGFLQETGPLSSLEPSSFLVQSGKHERS